MFVTLKKLCLLLLTASLIPSLHMGNFKKYVILPTSPNSGEESDTGYKSRLTVLPVNG